MIHENPIPKMKPSRPNTQTDGRRSSEKPEKSEKCPARIYARRDNRNTQLPIDNIPNILCPLAVPWASDVMRSSCRSSRRKSQTPRLMLQDWMTGPTVHGIASFKEP